MNTPLIARIKRPMGIETQPEKHIYGRELLQNELTTSKRLSLWALGH